MVEKKCVSLGEFRRRKAERQRLARPPSVALNMADVAGRDFSGLRDGVYAVLRLRDILEAHMGPDPEWQTLVLALLAEVHARSEGRGRPERFRDCCAELKGYVEDWLTAANRLDLGGAVVLLALLEKSAPDRIGHA